MARILAISSQVARGTVGLSIIVPALQALGHEVIALPTVVLSNHPGHAHVAGTQIEPAVLARMLDALDDNGWLAGVDAVMTGYLPSVAHVMFAASAVRLVADRRKPNPLVFLCDPVLGDDPKGLYIDRSAAEAIRDVLIPSADLATPNRFELSFLTGRDISKPSDVVRDVDRHGLGCETLFATSIPSYRPNEVVNVAATAATHRTEGRTATAGVPLLPLAPNGTGDLFSALVLASWLESPTAEQALSFATAGVDYALRGSTSDMIPAASLPGTTTQLSWPVVPWVSQAVVGRLQT